MTRDVPVPGPVEILANALLGLDGSSPALPAPAPGGIVAAFDAVLVRALSRPPCAVSFSGGRDSSAVLALATDAARRHGLPEPIPVTMRFPGAGETNEAEWQRLVLEHLGLPTQELIELRDELDVLGPAATRVLRRLGVRWPGNAYMHSPIIDRARGGTVLTGVGGDELFDTRAPGRRARAAALGALPARVREEVWVRRREPPEYPWLTEEGRTLVWRGLVRDESRWPYPWSHALRYWQCTRAYAATDGALGLVAQDRDVVVINPFLDAQVLAEFGQVGGRRGFASRTEAMRRLFGSLLPDRLLARSTKASFTSPAWGGAVREFGQTWDGSGVDDRYVDVGRLKAQLASPQPSFRAILLVQTAWLSAASS